MHTAQLVGPVKELEPFLVRRKGAVEGLRVQVSNASPPVWGILLVLTAQPHEPKA
jgi:hypothetical protein